MGRKKIRGRHVTLSVSWPAAMHRAFRAWAKREKRSACSQAVKHLGSAMRQAGVKWAGMDGAEEGRTVPPQQDMDGRTA